MNRFSKYAFAAAASLLVPVAGVSGRPQKLLIDVRVHGTGDKEVFVSNPGETFTLDVFASVTGNDSDLTNDGLSSFVGSFLTSNGGLLGNLSPLNVQAPFNGATSSPGVTSDLDGDGDLDIGTNSTVSSTGMFSARAGVYIPVNQTLIGQFTFSTVSLSAPSTDIIFRGTNLPATVNVKFDGAGTLLHSTAGVFVSYGQPVTVRAQQIVGSGTTTFLSGNVNTHVTVDGTVLPTAGSTVVLTNGLTVHAGGSFDMRDATNLNHEVRIDDNASGNLGGSLFVNRLTAGYTTSGSFVQTAGLTSIGNELVAGNTAGANGTVRMEGGSLFATNLTIAKGGGSGTYEQAGGQSSFSTLIARPSTGATALLTVTGGQVGVTNAFFDDSNGGAAHFTQSNGAANMNGTLSFSGSPTADVGGTLDGGVLAVGRLVLNGRSKLTQNGGTLNAGFVNLGGTGLGAGEGFILNAGQANLSGASINKSNGSSPLTITQNGGTLGVAGSVFVEHGANGVVVNGGTFFAERFSSLSGGAILQTGGVVRLNTIDMSSTVNGPASPGRLNLHGGQAIIGKQLVGSGTIDFGNAATELTVADGSFADFSKVTFTGSSNASVFGETNSLMQFAAGFDPLSAFGSFDSDGIVHIAGEPLTIPQAAHVGGSGNIQGNVTNNGTVGPGNSPGEIDILGNYAQGVNGHLEIQIGGTTAEDFDLLAITGAATLDGTLDISLLGTFTPSFSNSFTILTAAGGIGGRFANTTGDQVFLDGGRFDITYGANGITLTHFVAVPEPAMLGTLMLAGAAMARRKRRAI